MNFLAYRNAFVLRRYGMCFRLLVKE